jgi:alpha-amylase
LQPLEFLDEEVYVSKPTTPNATSSRPTTDRAAMLDARRRVRPHLRPRFGAPLAKSVAAVGPAGVARNAKPTDVLLQGFHWNSHASQNPNWYQILAQNAGVIKDGKFDVVWFPPPSESADAEGYMPTRWNIFDTSYGSSADLKAAITALRPVRSLADVVINHRCGIATAGADFDSPPFADQTGAITKNDECGIGTGNYDTGENNTYARDLDHTASQVQQAIVTYMKLLQSQGFCAWRYDEAKGYGGFFAGMYDDATAPYLSVGEVWDNDRQVTMNWIDATGGRSMAFDFPTRTLLQAAITQRLFSELKTIDGKPTGAIGWWPAMCVTFVDDHDTASDGTTNQPFGDGDQVLQAYAYLMTHPGIPCVFWSHYFDWGPAIQQTVRQLVAIRKSAGLNSSSVVNIIAADDQQKYAAIIDGKVALKLGPAAWDPGAGWTVATSGNDFGVWTVNP